MNFIFKQKAKEMADIVGTHNINEYVLSPNKEYERLFVLNGLDYTLKMLIIFQKMKRKFLSKQ